MEEKWRFPAKGSDEKVGPIHATPTVVNGHVYFGTARFPAFYKLKPDGTLAWVYRIPKNEAPRDLPQGGVNRIDGYPEPFAKFGGMTGQPVWEKLMGYAPIEDIDRCKSCAKLFIIAENKELFDNRNHAIAAHSRATGVKKLVTVEGIKHYGIYNEKRKEAQQLAVDWFSKHLHAEPQAK